MHGETPPELVFQIEVMIVPQRHGGGGVVGTIADEEGAGADFPSPQGNRGPGRQQTQEEGKARPGHLDLTESLRESPICHRVAPAPETR